MFGYQRLNSVVRKGRPGPLLAPVWIIKWTISVSTWPGVVESRGAKSKASDMFLLHCLGSIRHGCKLGACCMTSSWLRRSWTENTGRLIISAERVHRMARRVCFQWGKNTQKKNVNNQCHGGKWQIGKRRKQRLYDLRDRPLSTNNRSGRAICLMVRIVIKSGILVNMNLS